MKKQPVKTRVMSIVHGKSELAICSSIKSNLRLKHEIIARDNGKSSIQINGLKSLLNDSRFCSFRNFVKAFPDVEHDKHGLLHFRLFIIMDVDDCDEATKKQFISGELFAQHWLKDYIIPIYNEPNLEHTMKQAGIEVQKKKDYIQIFPTNHGDLDVAMAKDFLQKLKKYSCTNLDEYVEYCLSLNS